MNNKNNKFESGILYVVAVPIGNWDDITYRAVKLLQEVDLVACEDTRKSGLLLSHLGIKKPLASYHSHSSSGKEEKIVARLKSGEQVALLSDGGTPAVSDPGSSLIRRCREEGIAVIPLPGASALTAALSVSGFASSSVYFAGFLSPKGSKRRKLLETAAECAKTIVCYESPRRIRSFLKDLYTALGNVDILICREISKQYEEYIAMNASEAESRKFTEKGEFTIVIDVSSLSKKRYKKV